MATAIDRFAPDYAVAPGEVLREHLQVRGISQAEFARRCGRSPKLISEIVAGTAPVLPDTALQFEKVLGLDATVWLALEQDYRLHRAKADERAEYARRGEWLKEFPVQELVQRGVIDRPDSDSDAVSKILSFFRVGSVEAWHGRYDSANVAYRHSARFKSKPAALATWLRIGEIEAEAQECPPFDRASFRRALKAIRGLTREPVDRALDRATRLCNRSGVALALVKPFPGTALSGAAWWPSTDKGIVQLSARHKSDDHLWFSFFHEAAHLLLHGKRNVFVDETGDGNTDLEAEANEWACNALVVRSRWERFVAGRPRSHQAVLDFAEEVELAPGIVVGMLQHGGHLPWSHLNGLKVFYRWSDERRS